MVSVNPNPAQGFYLFDPMNMGLPGLNSMPPPTATATTASAATSTTACTASSTPTNATSLLAEDQSKKIRKPYTITKSRESWTEQEHDKFLEALQLFDRDWKKIEAFVGSKTVIQIRSHAQKYFLKVQKKGTSEHVPPPRPKRKATHPYPQKAPKSAAVVSQVAGQFQSSSALLNGYVYQPDSSFALGTPVTSATLSSWSYNSVPPVNVSQITKDDGRLAGPTVAHNSCYSSSNESIGVESERCASFSAALEAGKPVPVAGGPTIADGLAVPTVGVNAFVTAAPLVDRMVVVKEETVAVSILRLVELEKCVVEGAGACGLAAILDGQLDEFKGKKLVLLLCGGNIDTTVLGRCLERGLAVDGRLMKFSVTVSDRPGGIAELCSQLARLGVSIKDIEHERAWIASDVFSVSVTVTCETRDMEHANELRDTLNKNYTHIVFPVMR